MNKSLYDDFIKLYSNEELNEIKEKVEELRPWLTFMYPRLELDRDLLSEDGCVFISLDDNETINAKFLCDLIFGEGNFIGQITVVANPRGRDYYAIDSPKRKSSESFTCRFCHGKIKYLLSEYKNISR